MGRLFFGAEGGSGQKTTNVILEELYIASQRNGKPIGAVYNGQFFIESVDDRNLMARLIRATCK